MHVVTDRDGRRADGSQAGPDAPSTGVWHELRPDEVVARFATDRTGGLSPSEVSRRRARYGPNTLPEKRRRPLATIFLHQFQSPLIYLLFIAAAIAFALGERADAAVILVVVVANALIGAFQEGRAEHSMDALRQLLVIRARVLRAGQEDVIEARDLVPGDVVLLAAGDSVGADARLVESAAMEVAEAALTGESLPVTKEPVPLGPDTPLADRRNMVYAGTHVTTGRGRAVVVAIGSLTEVGRIAVSTDTAAEPKTTLERRIEQFGRFIVFAAAMVFAVVIAVGFSRGLAASEILMVAVSQVVSMVPEGLPVALTIALAVGMQRMAARHAIVRRLGAVETLGSVSVICTDKTGTLTRNEMTATTVHLPGGTPIQVTGVGFAPEGRFFEGPAEVQTTEDASLRTLIEAGALCNDAVLLAPDAGAPMWRGVGDPVETALLVLAKKGGVDLEALRHRRPRSGEFPFDPAVKMMATEHPAGERPGVIVKGAPEVVLDLCSKVCSDSGGVELTDATRLEIRSAIERMAASALRVLAFAEIPGARLDPAGYERLRGHAIFCGLIGLFDPPRPEVRNAVLECRAAGIRPVMVTGDHQTTGLAVARMLAIARDTDIAIDGRALDRMPEAELRRELDRIAVFARVHPAQKLRIVQTYQARGDVVAMTGDGVNDAPALARADVGIAMGMTGTEVAKEAAKVVITDDNFTTIVSAVEEGRLVFRNLKKVVLYLFSTSAAAILVLLPALLIGYPVPLVAVQILWINIVTEGVVTVNLIMERAEGDEMRRMPIPRTEPLLTRELLQRMAILTPAIAVSVLGFFVYHLAIGVPIAQARTEAFTVLAVAAWFNVLNCRSGQQSALRLDILKNPWLLGGLLLGNLLHVAVIYVPAMNRVFHTVPLPAQDVIEIGIAGSLVLWVEEVRKWIARRRSRA